MPKRKKPEMLPWASAELDNREKSFSQFGLSLFKAKQFQALPLPVQKVYLCMILSAAGKPEFTFSRKTADDFGIAQSTLRRGVERLIADGFILCTERNQNLRQPNRYRFSTAWKLCQSSIRAP